MYESITRCVLEQCLVLIGVGFHQRAEPKSSQSIKPLFCALTEH